MVDLTGRRVVVVGGGAVAHRRVPALLEAGAVVHVVAPRVLPELAALDVTVHRRSYRDGDLADAWLVHACTDVAEVNAAVAAEAERRRILCVRADNASGGTAHTPAVARAGEVRVAVGAGGDPRRAAVLRNAVAALLDAGALPVRPRRAGGGRVTLVGGGPGDPELITVRGRRLIAEADVVVVDRLAPRAILDTLDDTVEVIEAGKAPHCPTMTQDEINAVLVDRARRGLRVVRLKGGDPLVFGRGGEEVTACRRAGVPVEVVPGVSSALAGPAAAGIPVTHRGVASAFTVVSGHSGSTGPGGSRRPGGAIDWRAVARGADTLVLLMALEHLAHIATELIAGGRAADTPVAVVREATLPGQVVLVATLRTVADAVRQAGLRPPAVVVVGDVVALREESA